MTYQQIIKIVKNNVWKLEECPAVFYIALPWLKGWLNCGKKFGIKAWTVAAYGFRGDYVYEFTKEKEALKGADEFVKNYLRHPSFLEKVISEWRKETKRISKKEKIIFKRKFKNFSNKKLWFFLDEVLKDYAFFVTGPLIVEAFDLYTERVILPKFQKIFSFPQKELFNYFAILSRFNKRSLLQEERLNFLKICLKFPFKKEIHPYLISHARKFYWTQFNYRITKKREPEEFLIEVKKEIRKKSKKEILQELESLQELPKKYLEEKQRVKKILSLPKEMKKIFKLLATLSWWQDQRKMVALKYTYFLNEIAEEIAIRFGYSLEDIQYTLPEEIKNLLLKKNKKLNKKEISRRKKFIIAFATKKSFSIFSGQKAKNLINIFLKQIYDKNKKEIKGVVVSYKGEKKIFRGKVKIVRDIKKDIFKKGEILVTSMTRPEFLPVVRQAKAIITDEGGLTSHAAIVSRELKIPCIVGTKIATKVLKDGDLVEVDANKGVVRILK